VCQFFSEQASNALLSDLHSSWVFIICPQFSICRRGTELMTASVPSLVVLKRFFLIVDSCGWSSSLSDPLTHQKPLSINSNVFICQMHKCSVICNSGCPTQSNNVQQTRLGSNIMYVPSLSLCCHQHSVTHLPY